MDNRWSRHQRSGFPLSVLMIDLDHFKSFNDSAGHPAGDRCLARVAAALNESLRRPTDQLAPAGVVAEFLAALPDTPSSPVPAPSPWACANESRLWESPTQLDDRRRQNSPRVCEACADYF